MSDTPKRKTTVATPQTERRFLSDGELRVKADETGTRKKIVGYATKFNVLSDDLGGFRERIDEHAFDDTLAANVDCRALWNHDPNHILGRTTAGTLRLSVDGVGLHYEIDPPDTTLAKDLIVSLQRGDITQSSFAFICVQDAWQDVGGQIIRTVLKAELLDVSPVTFAAYPDATSGVRASLKSCPAYLRAQLNRRDEDEDDDEDNDESICDPDSPDYAPLLCNDDEDRCQCPCQACADDSCDECSNADCADDNCASCPVQEREARYALLLRRLR